jgi:subtilisin
MAVAMLFACAGVVLAQSQDPGDGQTIKDEGFAEDTAGLDAGDPIPGKYIVVLENEVANPASVASDLSEELGLETTNVYDDALEGFAAEVPAGELTELRADSRVASVVQDRVVEAYRQKKPTGIRRIDADLSSTRAGNGKGKVNADIAILDSGIYEQHMDLNIAGGINFVGTDRTCTGQNKSAYSDGYGHGTHVAGIAAAKDNSIGVVGVAPGARLWAVRVLGDDGSGSLSSALCGIDWITGRNTDSDTTNDIEVANMSFGTIVTGSDDGACGWISDDRDDALAATLLHQAVCTSVAAGTFYTAAAGNERANLRGTVPAAFDEVLTVTSMVDYNGKPGGGAHPTCERQRDDKVDYYSNYTTTGSTDKAHTIAAPGVCIRSTWKNGGYNTISGTSMAAPHVAGTAALCIASGPCAAGDPEGTMKKIQSDAAARPKSYGYQGDPNHQIRNRYYGYLEYAGGY